MEKPVKKAIEVRQETQEAQDKWREERQRLAEEYDHLEQEMKQLDEQKRHLEETTSAAKLRIAEKEKQLADIEQISARIEPFLEELMERLHDEIKDDLPFLPEERTKRLTAVGHMMTEPDVTISEKFRKIMEALMVEAEYGKTIEVYQETITVEGRDILVNIFRLGRLALFYQSLNQKDCGFYNVAKGAWHPLPDSYNYAIQIAMDIGAKRRPVELLSLPVGKLVVR